MLKCISCGKEVMLKECLLKNATKIDEHTCVCPAWGHLTKRRKYAKEIKTLKLPQKVKVLLFCQE